MSAWCARLATKPIGLARRPREARGARPLLREDGRDHRHVGQVRPTEVRVVEDRDVALGPGGERLDRADGLRHRAEVDGDVRRLRERLPGGVEDRAGEVLPLLDVGRERGVPQRRAHLLGGRGDERVEDREPCGIDVAHRRPPLTSLRIRLPDASRSGCARQPGGTSVVVSSCVRIAGPSIPALPRLRRSRMRVRRGRSQTTVLTASSRRLAVLGARLRLAAEAGGARLHACDDDLHVAVRIGVAEALLVRLGEGATQRRGAERASERHGQLVRLSRVAQIDAALDAHAAPVAVRRERRPRLRIEVCEGRTQRVERPAGARRDAQHQPAREVLRDVGVQHAGGGEHARRGGDDHRLDAQLGGHLAGVERPRAPEGDEGEPGRVEAALDRDQAQGAHHVGVDDLDHRARGAPHVAPEGGRDRREGALGAIGMERHVAAEEAIRPQPPERDVRIGDRR